MDPRDQTFMTIHNLTPDANILFASDSILDILGYQPDEVKGKSAFDYFHPEEVPFARSVHSRGVLLDKAAVLHYARVLSKTGQWVSCECCFTVVHNVLVASTSIYFKGERSERRARDAPQIRRIFSSSPRDPRYRMLEHLSPKFKMPPMEREPRAALILNRFTRNLNIMYATDAVAQILGLVPNELLDRPFYECIQPNCIEEAEKCLESAKANESIAYLRFWYKDPRADHNGAVQEEEEEVEDMDDEDDERSSVSPSEPDVKEMQEEDNGGMEVDEPEGNGRGERARDEDEVPPRRNARRSRPPCRRRPQAPQTFELEAVVSCTSDGLVVVLRRARPPIPDPQPPVIPAAFNFENGLFAAPWGLQPIEPYISPELLYNFRPPLLPQYMPLRECIKAAGGPPIDQLMRSIRDVAVFAWAVTGINGTLASYGQGRPRIGAQPADGLPIWESNSSPTPYNQQQGQGLDNSQGDTMRRQSGGPDKEQSTPGPLFGLGGYSQSGEPLPAHQQQGYPRTRHASLDEGMYDAASGAGARQPLWPPQAGGEASASPSYQYGGGGGGSGRGGRGYEPAQHQQSYRRPLRPAFSYDALHDHARYQQATAAAYGAPSPSSSSSLSSGFSHAAAFRQRCNGFREDIWGVETPSSSSTPSSQRSCAPSYGAAARQGHYQASAAGGARGRTTTGDESSKGGGEYFWQ